MPELPDTTQIVQRTTSLVESARALTIQNPDDYSQGSEYLRAFKAMRDQIKVTFDAPIAAAHKAHKAMLAAKKKHDDPLAQADNELRRKMGSWKQEEERERREEEDRLRREAQAKAEEERLAEAAKLEEQGRAEEADRLIESPVTPPPTPIIPTAVPKEDGISTRVVWKFRIVDEALIPREYLMPDEKKLGSIARAMKGQANVPGVDFYAGETMQVRSA